MSNVDNEQDERKPAEEGTTSSVRPTRRTFLTSLGATSLAATAAPLLAHAAAETLRKPAAKVVEAPGTVPVVLRINGKVHQLQIEPRVTLLDCVREVVQMTGTKKGCDHGQCGACTVHIDGHRANSCLTFAIMHQGQEITTIEGLGTPENLHPMQASFAAHDAFQCGYCTSGQIMSAVAMTKEPWGPENADVKEAMAGNICRCGTYPNIVAAIQFVRSRGASA